MRKLSRLASRVRRALANPSEHLDRRDLERLCDKVIVKTECRDHADDLVFKWLRELSLDEMEFLVYSWVMEILVAKKPSLKE